MSNSKQSTKALETGFAFQPHFPASNVASMREEVDQLPAPVAPTETTIFDESRDLTAKIQALNPQSTQIETHNNTQTKLNATNGEINVLAMSGMSPLSGSEFHPTSHFNYKESLNETQAAAFTGTNQSESIAAKLEQFKHELKKSSEAVA